MIIYQYHDIDNNSTSKTKSVFGGIRPNVIVIQRRY